MSAANWLAGPGRVVTRRAWPAVVVFVVGWSWIVHVERWTPPGALLIAAVGLAVWSLDAALDGWWSWHGHPSLRAQAVVGILASVVPIGCAVVTLAPTRCAVSWLLVMGVFRALTSPALTDATAGVIVGAATLGCGGLAITSSGDDAAYYWVGAAVIVVSGIVGWARRRRNAAVSRETRRLEERLALAGERELTAAMGERERLARELHDVLAHSLGALSLQLSAVEALQEQGCHEEAARRVGRARGLVADGLTEARRAIAALRGDASDLSGSLAELVEVHRSLGERADLEVCGRPSALDAATHLAVQRAAQEALTNARKHAAGAISHLRVEHGAESVRLEVRTPRGRPAAHATTGSGQGLRGMVERCTHLGGSATAGREGQDWVVRCALPIHDDWEGRS